MLTSNEMTGERFRRKAKEVSSHSKKGAENESSNSNWTKLQIEDRYLKDSFRAAGFQFETCIYELIDNSIDAGATLIQITTEKNEDDSYNITIKDNGGGIDKSNIQNVIMKLGFGNPSSYRSNSISNFGVGLKYALVNLSKFGNCEISSTKNGIESKVILNLDSVPCVSQPSFNQTSESNGTTIYIPNISVSSHRITGLIKYLGVTYFPHIDNGHKLDIQIIHNNQTKSVIFTDPLYRNINPSNFESNGISVNNEEIFIDGYKVTIKARHFFGLSEDKMSTWDIQQGSTGFSVSKSGVYFRLNGRYITLGDNNFHLGSRSIDSKKGRGAMSNTQSGVNRTRVEIEFDRALIPVFGVGFNKSKIEIDNSDGSKLNSLLKILSEILTWSRNKYLEHKPASNNSLTADQEEERNKIDNDLNATRRKFPISPEIFDTLEDITSKSSEISDKTEKKTKKRPSNLTYNKRDKAPDQYVPLNIKYLSNGRDRAFQFYKENGSLVLAYSTEHDFYQYYNLQETQIKRLIDTIFVSMCESLSLTESGHCTDEYYSIEDDILRNFSDRLSKYNRD